MDTKQYEYYDPSHESVALSAARLYSMPRRYKCGGILMGAGGLKAGPRISFGRERIIPTSIERIVSKRPGSVRKAEWKAGRPSSIVGPNRGARGSMTEIRPEIFVTEPEMINDKIQGTLESQSLSELRKNLLNGQTRAFTNDSASPTQILMRDAIYGTYNGETRGMIDSRASNIRRRILSVYNEVKNERDLSPTQKQQAFVDNLVNDGLLVETQYGTMYADGSYFNPQHTPLEDFLISDGAVSLNDLSVNGLMNNYW